MLTKIANRMLGIVGLELRKSSATRHSNVAAALKPEGTVRGKVLLSYIPDAFTSPEAESLSHRHTHYWESHRIATTFLNNGFEVDVVHYDDGSFIPKRDYDILVSARTNLERLAKLLPVNCLKIAHLDTAHFLTNNANA